jgi:hypothetical protein
MTAVWILLFVCTSSLPSCSQGRNSIETGRFPMDMASCSSGLHRGGAPFARFNAANAPGLEKVPSPCCLMTPIGNERASAISEREPNNETDRESNFEARRHAAVTPLHEILFQAIQRK